MCPTQPLNSTSAPTLPIGEPPRWYALKVFYNRVAAVRDTIAPLVTETYAPMAMTMVEGPTGARHKVEKPLVSSLLFARATTREISSLGSAIEGKALVYSRPGEPGHTPLPITDDEMNLFMLVTSRGENGIEYLGDDHPRYHKGARVRVTDGPFKGSEGHIIRIRTDRRLVVTVNGVCAVATGYIPRAFLEIIN